MKNKYIKDRPIIQPIMEVWYNLELLKQFEDGINYSNSSTIREFYSNFLNSIYPGLQSYKFLNKGILITSLYGLIIYPHECLKSKIPFVKLDLETIKEWGDFNFLGIPKLSNYDKVRLKIKDKFCFTDLDILFVIQKIRNSLSHNNFEVSDSYDFTFNDKDKTSIQFKIEGLETFIRKYILSCVNDWKCIDLVN